MEIPKSPADTDSETTPDPGARSAAYMRGRAAFGDGIALDDVLLDTADATAEELEEIQAGWNEAQNLAADEPGFVRQVDELPPAEEDVALAIGERLSEARILNYVDKANELYTPAELEGVRTLLRERLQRDGEGDPMEALGLILLGATTEKERAAWTHAAVTIRDQGHEGSFAVPSLDTAPPEESEEGGKKKRKGKGKRASSGPKKSKRAFIFVKHIGTATAGFKASFAPDESRLLEMLKAGGFNRREDEIGKAPAWGFCPIVDATGTTMAIEGLPTICALPDFVVFGLRRDAKTGCPTFRFRSEAERQATEAAGHQNASRADINAITKDLVDRWYREATPTTRLIPCMWQRSTWTLWVHSSDSDAQTHARDLAALTLGQLDRLPELLDGLPTDLHKTDLCASDGTQNGTAEPGSDILLWLAGKTLLHKGLVPVNRGSLPSAPTAEGGLEFWVDRRISLEGKTEDGKDVRSTFSGDPIAGGRLAGALSEGDVIRSARVSMKFAEERWSFTLTSMGTTKGWEQPTLLKVDGTPEGLDSVMRERVDRWQLGRDLLDVIVASYQPIRADRGNWRQMVAATRRAVVEVLDAARIRFIEKTGQVPLFVEGRVEAETLGGVKVKDARDEAPPVKPASRGGRARAAAADRAVV